MPALYDLSPATGPWWPCRARRTPRWPGSSTDSASVPGVEVEIREKHPFDGPLVVSVDGHDRTIGEKVARQILVRTEHNQPQEEKGAV